MDLETTPHHSSFSAAIWCCRQVWWIAADCDKEWCSPTKQDQAQPRVERQVSRKVWQSPATACLPALLFCSTSAFPPSYYLGWLCLIFLPAGPMDLPGFCLYLLMLHRERGECVVRTVSCCSTSAFPPSPPPASFAWFFSLQLPVCRTVQTSKTMNSPRRLSHNKAKSKQITQIC